ncbi:MAG: efflux RND transporter permease subunit [bacterium]
MKRLVDYLIDTPIVAGLLAALLFAAGLYVSPFEHGLGALPRDPVAVDALPDIGENQQIVFTRWPGRSPQDVEDQVTYPLTAALLGLPGVRTVRSQSAFGYSSVHVIFGEEIEFYWSRSRILEKLAALPPDTLPDDARPELGPDATALGQIFWYTLEAPGFDLHELRTLQDTQVRYALQSVEGVAEVASVGGYVREYQVDVDPDALRAHRISLGDVYDAVRRANVEVGARTIEINRVEYVLRGVGFVRGLDDLRRVVVAERDNVPITLAQVAHITAGPADRRGALDKGGAEAVGGVVVVRYGANPREVIDRVHAKIAEIAPGMPSRDGARVQIVPFYDRTTLIDETLGTLRAALTDEILVTIAVIVVMVWQLRASFLVAGLLPLAVLLAFAGMKLSGVDAHIMSLAGIAIAIGTMVDMGIILVENTLRHLADAPEDEPIPSVVKRATGEVASAVLTAVATTVVSFLPVFTMTGAEGKLFRPLAFTKTYALLAAIAVALVVLPAFAALLWRRPRLDRLRAAADVALLAFGVIAAIWLGWLAALALWLLAAWRIAAPRLAPRPRALAAAALNAAALCLVLVLLAAHWAPLGPGLAGNLLLVVLVVGGVLGFFALFLRSFEGILRWCLAHKLLFLTAPTLLLAVGWMAWRGAPIDALRDVFPGLQEDFMPALDEGSFLYMPTTMPHASLGEALDVLQLQDRAIAAIPEVEAVVGKIGRVESALDPAPVSMIETVITYKPEYGPRDPETGERARQWREHIRSPDDIWAEITAAAQVPGTTAAPKLQPIAARIVMLQSGLRASMGVEVRGQHLDDIEALLHDIEQALRHVDGIDPATVFADRIVGKPYLEIHIDREAIARYGLDVADVQDVIEVAIGGKPVTTAVEGRARYRIRVRYPRELRDRPEALAEVLVPTARGVPIPLAQVADIRFTRGPMMIKSVDTALVGYVTFDRSVGAPSEVEMVRRARARLDGMVAAGEMTLPAGSSYAFTGTFENQVRAEATLQVVLPLSLVLILLILYIQFRRISTALMVFTGIAVAWAGGFVLLWCYQQPWFLDAAPLGVELRELFNVRPFDLTIAVWVGFIALFGIATDDGVLMSTMLEQRFAEGVPPTVEAIREATIEAATRRIRPCLMTTATTLLALLPVVTSDGRGADVMIPMALPSVGGMTFELLTLFVVPVLYCGWRELGLRVRAVG